MLNWSHHWRKNGAVKQITNWVIFWLASLNIIRHNSSEYFNTFFLFHCLKIWFFWNFPYQYITYRFISFEKDVVSIRLNKPLHRNDFIKHLHSLNQTSWQFVCIEEPFTLSNTAYSIYEERTYLAIKRTFAASLSELETTRDLGEVLRESRIFWWIDKVITNKYFHIFCFDLFCCIYICRMDCTKSWRMYMLMSWIKIKFAYYICFISFNIIVIPFFVCIYNRRKQVYFRSYILPGLNYLFANIEFISHTPARAPGSQGQK